MSDDPTKDDIKLRAECDDETWEFVPWRDLTGLDWLAMERHRDDLSRALVVNAMISGQVSVLALALWAYRREDEPDLTYEDVLGAVTADSFTVVMPDPPEKPPKKKPSKRAADSKAADERPS